jgi:hypothetical protein
MIKKFKGKYINIFHTPNFFIHFFNILYYFQFKPYLLRNKILLLYLF